MNTPDSPFLQHLGTGYSFNLSTLTSYKTVPGGIVFTTIDHSHPGNEHGFKCNSWFKETPKTNLF